MPDFLGGTNSPNLSHFAWRKCLQRQFIAKLLIKNSDLLTRAFVDSGRHFVAFFQMELSFLKCFCNEITGFFLKTGGKIRTFFERLYRK